MRMQTKEIKKRGWKNKFVAAIRPREALPQNILFFPLIANVAYFQQQKWSLNNLIRDI